MEYYFLQTTGNLQNEDQLFIEESPDGLGWHDYYLSIGEYAAPYYPENCRITIRSSGAIGDISDFIGNSRGYFIASVRLKDVLKKNCADIEIEYLPVKLYSRENRLICDDYSFINPIGTVDCLNEKESQIRYDRRGDIISMEKLVLDAAKLGNSPRLFRIYRKPMWYVFNGELASAFSDAGITNLIGEKLPVC